MTTQARHSTLTGHARDGLVTDPLDRTGIRSSSSVTTAGASAFPPVDAPAHRYCIRKGCGRRVVRGVLGSLAWVHAERSPFPHYARPNRA